MTTKTNWPRELEVFWQSVRAFSGAQKKNVDGRELGNGGFLPGLRHYLTKLYLQKVLKLDLQTARLLFLANYLLPLNSFFPPSFFFLARPQKLNFQVNLLQPNELFDLSHTHLLNQTP